MVVEAKLCSPIHSTFEALVVLPQPNQWEEESAFHGSYFG